MSNGTDVDNFTMIRDPKHCEYTSFPTGVLPDLSRSYVRESARAIGCDETHVGLPMLSQLGGAIGMTRRIRIKNDWREYPIIWQTVAAPSGTMQTPAQKIALRHLHRVQNAAVEEHKDKAAGATT